MSEGLNPNAGAIDRQRQAHMFDRFLDLTGIETVLGDEESRHDFVQSLTPQTFTNYLVRMNGILLDKPREGRGFAGNLQFIGLHQDELAVFDVPPLPVDKQRSLEHLLTTAQSLENVNHQALLIGYGANAIHPFDDGNGRVARAAYHLLAHGYRKDDPRLFEVLQENGDQKSRLESEIFADAIYQPVQVRLGTHQAGAIAGLSVSVPKLQPTIKNPGTSISENPPSRRDPNPDQDRDLYVVLRDVRLAETLPLLLINRYSTRSARDACDVIDGQNVFYVDEFFANASQKDIDNLYATFRTVKQAYLDELLESLAGRKNTHVDVALNTNEFGLVQDTIPNMAFALAEGLITPDLVNTLR